MSADMHPQPSATELIDQLREAVGWKQLTPAEVAKRCESIVVALREALEEKLIAVTLFDSWARGDADKDSEIDLLVIADGLPEHPIERV